MSRYLIEASYNAEGMKGLIAEGGTARVTAVEKALADVGGTVESFDFAFGTTDAYVIADVPDHTSAAALGMLVGAGGASTCKITVLLTPAEIDQAAQVKATYRKPGG